MKNTLTLSKVGPSSPSKVSAFRRIGWREAEQILGARVKNRRRAFYFCDDPEMMEILCGGPVFEYGEWTASCSGCFETEDGHPVGDYPWDAKAGCHIGSGCDECGYTGKRRDSWHSPAEIEPKVEASAAKRCARWD